MNIYLLYNTASMLKSQINQEYITKISEEIFGKKLSSFTLKECTNLSTGKSELDYYCIIDTKISIDPLGKKRNFSDKLHQIMGDINGRSLNGMVKLKTDFNINQDVKINEKASESSALKTEQEFDYEQRAEIYNPVIPAYTFDRDIFPEKF